MKKAHSQRCLNNAVSVYAREILGKLRDLFRKQMEIPLEDTWSYLI